MNRSRIIEDIPAKGKNVNTLRVEYHYEKGGMNYFSGNKDQRGIYMCVAPIELSERGWSSMLLASGIKKLVKPMKRFSQKVLDTLPVDEDLKAKLIKHVMDKEGVELV